MPIKHFLEGVLVQTEPDTPEQIEERTEQEQIINAIAAINSASNLSDVKTILKKLFLRLVKKGVLP